MFIGSYETLQVGETKCGLNDANGDYHSDQPFTVLRVASKEEYLEYCKNTGVDLNEATLSGVNHPDAKFYLLSVD